MRDSEISARFIIRVPPSFQPYFCLQKYGWIFGGRIIKKPPGKNPAVELTDNKYAYVSTKSFSDGCTFGIIGPVACAKAIFERRSNVGTQTVTSQQ